MVCENVIKAYYNETEYIDVPLELVVFALAFNMWMTYWYYFR
jgi:hypothetical protein